MSEFSITPEEAKRIILQWQAQAPKSAYKGGSYPGKEIQNILSQPGCTGMIYYFAQKDDGTMVIVLAGTDANNKVMKDGVLLENSWLCPPICYVNGLDT